MEEFSLIHRYFRQQAEKAPFKSEQVVLGIGDDGSVLSIAPGQQLVVSVDTLVEGVHFLASADAFDIGTRAMCVALSDLAAMGAEPIGVTIALTLPKAEESWLEGFSAGVFSVLNEYECPLIGGDTTRGPLSVGVQVMGVVSAGGAVPRSGAQPGDHIYVSGTLGDSAAALSVLMKQQAWSSEPVEQFLKVRYYRPTPRFDVARELLKYANAAIDVSDGLYADLRHICDASSVKAVLDVDLLPLGQWPLDLYGREQMRQWALTGGDDYQICFTVPEDKQQKMLDSAEQNNMRLTKIGEIQSGNGIELVGQDLPDSLKTMGYNHFA
ncbi:thiamine-phosphate kinase [Teredinibacter sp. KSP-S5-2]|uniref:thiamine-phosphate kinase n=1 Tax=Teredinibacter sp. KSP-S5-2 TaxID=3034506 RepID=UPI0029343957|nr:thiamine-phosphate kinase [Teredinibacter sp. KSP-S5-2]WNO09452.1 thiamine-phosphate kinase [Teredinibacter sp. KSP-S5-2]